MPLMINDACVNICIAIYVSYICLCLLGIYIGLYTWIFYFSSGLLWNGYIFQRALLNGSVSKSIIYVIPIIISCLLFMFNIFILNGNLYVNINHILIFYITVTGWTFIIH